MTRRSHCGLGLSARGSPPRLWRIFTVDGGSVRFPGERRWIHVHRGTGFPFAGYMRAPPSSCVQVAASVSSRATHGHARTVARSPRARSARYSTSITDDELNAHVRRYARHHSHGLTNARHVDVLSVVARRGGLHHPTSTSHLHTQHNRDIPWSTIDMDFMNLNQAAHGDREHGFIMSRMRLNRKVVVGFWQEAAVQEKIGAWSRAAAAWHDWQGAKFVPLRRQHARSGGDRRRQGRGADQVRLFGKRLWRR